ncbi:hypothetical protein Z962_10780 [Clostridium botulinum C/D str. BKT12695]|nr:hypothetical protein Z962_10780 [Clostridium botulinum C/D str. BKT12695]
MKLKKSKKGSGLILVIMMFAFLSIVGMAFISMSLSSYKLRIAKSNAKTGLYGAESGIDEAYGIIGNKVDESIKIGNDEVDIFMDELRSCLIDAKKKIDDPNRKEEYKSLNNDGLEKIINEFKTKNNYKYLSYIKKCIQIGKNTSKEDNQEKQQENSYVKLYLNDKHVLESQNNIFKDAYTENILQGNKDKPLNILEEVSNCEFNINKEEPKIDAKIIIDKEEYSNFNDIENYLDKLKQNKKIPIRINSKFKYKGINKQVKADYIINIPPYNKSYYVKEDNQIVYKNPVFTKAISVDGNMNIDGKVDIHGDIFVKGRVADDSNSDNGIIINTKGKPRQKNDEINEKTEFISRFKGNVVTSKNFKIKGENAVCNVEGNIFANNVLLDKNAETSGLIVGEVKKDKSENEKKNQEDIKKQQYNIYTQDDLEIDAPNSTTIINGAYYGLNNGDKSTNAGSSSSININAVDDGKVNCKLDIKGKGSIIMGTSYAKFYKDEDEKQEYPYQTGESVSIKGNYKAYSFPSDKFKDFTFDYYLPKSDEKNKNNNVIVGLVSKNGSSKNLNAFEKSKYFENIVSSNDYKSIFNWDGIDVNGVSCIHLGAIYNKKNNEVTTNASSDKFIIDNLEIVCKKIQEFNTQVYNMGEKNDDIELLSSSKKSVYTQLDKIDNITEIYGKNIVVIRKGKTEIIDGKLNGKDNSKINGKNALIIVDGDLNIKGNLNFKGTLIVKKNLTIESGASLNIEYKDKFVRTLISKNYGKLKNVFTNNSEEIFDTLNKTQFDMDGHADTVLNNLIQMKNWKIIK